MPTTSLRELIALYDPTLPIERASTIPAPWYTDPGLAALEERTVFARSWQLIGRIDTLREPGDYVTAEIAGEPVLAVRGGDGVLRGFFNVCRHHAAAVVSAPCGRAEHLTCPYHGWTYSLDGALESTPQFGGARDFDRAKNGLVPLPTEVFAQWVFVRLSPNGPSLAEFLTAPLVDGVRALDLESLTWLERRAYFVECNWKAYVDNYLDGGYHVPHLHHGLDSVLVPGQYTIENGARHCLQSSAIRTRDAANPTADVRSGKRAHYYWIYPNFMINWYEGVMDTNVVVPRGPDRCEVIFDYWFADTGDASRDRNLASIAVSERIQDEDAAICASVQRGLRSRSYHAGRLSPRREAGEHLFHRLVYADLSVALASHQAGGSTPPGEDP
jgi:choline monooxygenase